MTTEELESKLEGGVETPTLDIKSACNWDVASFAKDILAMSNVHDGGYIIIGVEDKTFVRQGIDSRHKATYNIDIMRDQMAPYADPHVNFTVEFPKDSKGKEYAVIRVLSFEEIPVICRKDSKDTQAGAIYYRDKTKRVNHSTVSNSYDMRDIISTATVRMMQRMTEVGFNVQHQPGKAEQAENMLNSELKGL